MQCVLIAAGKGTRMLPITADIPKPLVPIGGTPLMDHIIAALPSAITEIIIVTNYLEEQIKTHCGTHHLGRDIVYVTQANPAGGTGDALLTAAPLVRDTFLFMYADDIHGKEALAEVVQHPHAMLAGISDHPEDFGVVITHKDGTLKEIIEKPKNPPSNQINISGFVISPEIFQLATPPNNAQGEVYVTDMLVAYAKHHPVQVVHQPVCIQVGRPEDIEVAESKLKNL